MTLSALLASSWLAVIFFFQTGSTPIWVPLIIILIIVLIFWWGLTRNRIPDEEEPAGQHGTADAESEADEPSAAAEIEDEIEESADTATEEAAGEEEANELDTAAAEEEEAPIVESEEPAQPPAADDLKVIEGIGPKISDLLADDGITTYDQLANTDVDELERIVRHEGGIKVANPASWPEQAALAAASDWDGLETLQNRLVAGRHK